MQQAVTLPPPYANPPYAGSLAPKPEIMMKKLAGSVIGFTLLAGAAFATPMSEKLLAAGDTALAADDLNGAREYYEQALVADPAGTAARVKLGEVQLDLDHPMAARKYFETVLEMEPDDLGALSGGGRADLALELEAEAEKKKERLLRLCGSDCGEYKSLKEALIAFKERPQMTEAERIAALKKEQEAAKKD